MDVVGDSGGQGARRLLVRLAERQYGVVAWWQLGALGMPRWMVDRELSREHLLPLHRGVFAVGHRVLTYRGRWLAAVLACGPDAVISHHAAAFLHDLRPMPHAAIDVTAPGRHRRDGIRCHISSLAAQDRTTIDRIPVTSIERTYLDYAEQATPRQLAAALEAGERRNILDLHKLQHVIHRSHGRRGVKPLKRAIAALTDDPAWTQSPLEDIFLELIAAAGLPRPRANVLIDGELVDFVWPRQRLIVELDGFAFHRTRARFEDDRRRDAKLQKRGWRILRITYRRLHDDPAGVISDIREMLATQ